MERKERTRRALLDVTLRLCEDISLDSLSLRQVAKEVGIVPTAFYRHFDSIEALGMTLVDESFESLRAMLRAVRRDAPSYADIVDASVTVLEQHVRDQRAHFAFIVRQRTAGPPAVRAAIAHEIELTQRELATDVARLPGTDAWSSDDLGVLSTLIVTAMVATTESYISARSSTEHQQIFDQSRTQLRIVLIGALNWRSKT